MSAWSNDERAALQQAWGSVLDRPDAETQFIVGGVNLRFNVAKGLKAVYLSAKLYFKAKTFAYPADVSALLGVGKDVYDLVIAGLGALLQKVGKAPYTVAAVMSQKEVPFDVEELRAQLDEFLKSDTGGELPWYLGIGRAEIDATRAALGQPGGLEAILASLEKSGLAQKVGNKWSYKSRHFSWRGELDAE